MVNLHCKQSYKHVCPSREAETETTNAYVTLVSSLLSLVDYNGRWNMILFHWGYKLTENRSVLPFHVHDLEVNRNDLHRMKPAFLLVKSWHVTWLSNQKSFKKCSKWYANEVKPDGHIGWEIESLPRLSWMKFGE